MIAEFLVTCEVRYLRPAFPKVKTLPRANLFDGPRVASAGDPTNYGHAMLRFTDSRIELLFIDTLGIVVSRQARAVAVKVERVNKAVRSCPLPASPAFKL